MKIKVSYRSIDRVSVSRTFETIKGARNFATKWVGPHPEIGSHYAVSGDGVGKITVLGASLTDLFPSAEAEAPDLTDREMEIAMHGDGRCMTYYGQDGDPRNGERLFNTKEMDAEAEEERRYLAASAAEPSYL